MKDPSENISDAIYTLLNGNITYNSKAVKVFQKTPRATEIGIQKGKLFHYVEIGEVTDTETGDNKSKFTHDSTVEVEVVVGFPGFGSKTVVNNIVNQVTGLIKPQKNSVLSLGSDFHNVFMFLESALERVEEGSHRQVIKTLRYRLEIDET